MGFSPLLLANLSNNSLLFFSLFQKFSLSCQKQKGRNGRKEEDTKKYMEILNTLNRLVIKKILNKTFFQGGRRIGRKVHYEKREGEKQKIRGVEANLDFSNSKSGNKSTTVSTKLLS